jgi:broad specificity phosphatase PhoE
MKRFSTSLESDIQKNCEVVSCMPEPLPELKNSYFLLRHGQSEGNVEGVISSARSLATSEKHGLTKLGYEQGVESAANLLDLLEQQHESSEDKRKVIFYSSPFSRARQTAQACLDGMRDEAQSERAKQIGVDIQLDMIIEDGLMERYVIIFFSIISLLFIMF